MQESKHKQGLSDRENIVIIGGMYNSLYSRQLR